MRKIGPREKHKRGCEFCADHRDFKGCIDDSCPYHELDDVKFYSEYEKKIKGDSPFERFMKKYSDVSDFVR
jgi:hypothetical protein